MNDFVLVTDAGCDLPKKLVDDLGIEYIAFQVEIDGKIYSFHPDLNEIDNAKFYSLLKSGASVKTSLINIDTYEEYFESFLKKDIDVIYVSLSSGLSGTYNSSVAACKRLSEKYPARKITAVDSLCASGGFAMLLYYATLKKNEGATYEEVKSYIEEIRHSIIHLFTVDDLNQLKRGGRISSATALFGTMMGIKPMLHISAKGAIETTGKVRGRKASIQKMFNDMKKMIKNPNGQTIFISHGYAEDDAKYLASLIKKEWKIKNIYIDYVGPSIGAHSGYGTLALFFLGEKREVN
ncbi:MAG: DegV family protein [Clostridia bacterium]|nr:DegV family protein [Clostridia bacterium]